MPTAPDPDRPRGAWPHIRAALVVAHLLAIGLSAVPAPEGGMRRAAWQDPTVQGEFAAWGDRLRGLGLGLTDAQLEDGLWDFAVRYMQVRKAALAPARPYYTHLGTGQSWRMFVAPHKHPSRLELAIDRGDDRWEVVYLQSTPGPHWMEGVLEHDRSRSLLFRYAWKSFRRSYRHMVDWLAVEAARDFPEATRLRARWRKQRSPTPAQVREGHAPRIQFHGTLVVDLDALRAEGSP